MKTAVQILLLIILISVIVVLISENRHPVKTAAWIVVLVCLPILGLVLYFFFGKDKSRKRLASNYQVAALKKRTADNYSENIVHDLPDEHREVITQLWTTNRAYPLSGNSLKTYIEFDKMFDDLMTDIENATDHIHFQFFKFENDSYGHRIAELLIRKAQEGVDVRVQYDDAVNLTRKCFFRWMAKGGVKVQPFLRIILPFISSNANYRNHRKVVVIDGKIGYTGGMNIAERYATGIKRGIWRDTHLRIEGPAVSELQTSFLIDWLFSSRKFLCSDRYYPKLPAKGDKTVQIATSGPMDEWRVIMQGFVQLFSNSHKYIYIQSPYFIPTGPIMMALKNAALAGVDVRVMFPYHGDRGIIVPLASRSYVREALSAGVKIGFYTGGYLHSKTIVIDDSFVTIGSTNIDVRSFEQDFELNAFIYDRELSVKMRETFEKDEMSTRYISAEEWDSRPRFEKFKESFARLFSPLL